MCSTPTLEDWDYHCFSPVIWNCSTVVTLLENECQHCDNILRTCAGISSGPVDLCTFSCSSCFWTPCTPNSIFPIALNSRVSRDGERPLSDVNTDWNCAFKAFALSLSEIYWLLDFLRVGISVDSDRDLFTYCQNFFGFEFKFAAMVFVK